VRGVPEATVSTPITWDEVKEVVPKDFTIATVPRRFAALGDLHEGIDEAVFSLDILLSWAERDECDEPGQGSEQDLSLGDGAHGFCGADYEDSQP